MDAMLQIDLRVILSFSPTVLVNPNFQIERERESLSDLAFEYFCFLWSPPRAEEDPI